MKKVKSLLAQKNKTPIQQKYEEIYKDASIWLYKKFDGIHSIIISQIKDQLKNSQVLDVGCGAGRLSLMSAHFAKEVEAFDFSTQAIVIARKIKELTQTTNIRFFVSRLETMEQKRKVYDVITMSEVIEHVPDPLATLKQLNKLLKKKGILVISCPHFDNFRGFSYMTLLKLLDLPMSLADLRQIHHSDIEHWSEKSGFRLKKCIGALYRFGWEEKGIMDMIQRTPLAIRDKRIKFPVHYRAYDDWLKSRRYDNRQYLDYLEKKRILKRIKKSVKLKIASNKQISPKLWQDIKAYLDEDVTSDPFFCEKKPFSYQGGDGIYILEKK